jgi:hypothetical protein
VVANDDITFGPGDLDRLCRTAVEHPEAYIVSCAGPHDGFGTWLPSHGYACFVLNPVALAVLGCFDENFFPAYCEDQDYARRAALASLQEANCSDTAVRHTGSATIGNDPLLRAETDRTHEANRAYYRRKWGGGAGRERWRQPFGDADLSLRIPPERRRSPYGGHDRGDLPGPDDAIAAMPPSLLPSE